MAVLDAAENGRPGDEGGAEIDGGDELYRCVLVGRQALVLAADDAGGRYGQAEE
jgi:hypothetical protein